MNPLTELHIVAVPGGSTKPGVVLRGVIIPRLSGLGDTATLSAYGMQDWPDLLRRSTIAVFAAASPQDQPSPVTGTVRSGADSAIWAAVFGRSTVLPYSAPPAYPDPDVLPSATHLDTVQTVYATAIRHGGDPATVGAQLQTVPDSTLPPAAEPISNDTTSEDPDFHRLATFFREHPAVLRALGLIIEIDIPDPAILAGLSGGVVGIELTLPADAPAAFTTASSWTRFEFGQGRFLPAPAPGSPIRRGMLDLSGPQWKVSTFDVAGTMDRLRLAKATTTTAPDRAATLPAIRSAGLSLLHGGRERHLRERNRTARANAARHTTELELWADDLVLGFRIDVRDSNSDWSSVCRRMAAYTTVEQALPIGASHEEEGHVKVQGATFRGGGRAENGANQLLADETIVRWDGWSMVCPHPQQTPRRDPGGPGGRPRWLMWAFTPVGVPALRFGRTYLVRMRVADIAGGGLGPGDPALTESASVETFYGRHDPVAPPEQPPPPGLVQDHNAAAATVHPDAIGPGGLLDVLVIRSDPGAPGGAIDVDEYAATHDYAANHDRMLLPPSAPFVACIQAGALDRPEHEAELDDDEFAALLGRATMPPAYTPDGVYSWLPDPAAEGVTLAALSRPGLGGPPKTPPAPVGWQVPDGKWPDYHAKHVHLGPRRPGEKAVDWLDGLNAIVRLAPAETVTVEVSSTVDDVGPFAMTNWMQHGLGQQPTDLPGEHFLDDLTKLVRDGRHPIVSPPRELHLVHAVQHPTNAPAGRLTATRQPGETFARLADARPDQNPWFGLDPPSTAQLDVAATWDEFDPMGTDRPLEQRSQQVGSFRLDLAAPALPEVRHEFGDTRYRIVNYTLTAISRFRAFFDPGQPETDFVKAASFAVTVDNTATPAPPVVLAVAPAFSWQTSVEGGHYSKTRRGGLLRVELARPWNLTGQDEQLGVVVVPITESSTATTRPFVSRIRRDPIWATGLPAGDLHQGMFPRSTAALPITPPGSAVPLTVVAHDVHFQTAPGGAPGGRWYADIAIEDPNESYCPFVELAVVRFQRFSLAGREASVVVRAEATQLLPNRSLTCSIDAAGIHVRLDGIGPAGGRPNVVRATIERLPAGLDPDLVELTELTAQPGGVPAWLKVATVDGTLGANLPPIAPPPDPPTHCRLVIQEIEQYAATGSAPNPELGERTVFLDIVRLSQLPA